MGWFSKKSKDADGAGDEVGAPDDWAGSDAEAGDGLVGDHTGRPVSRPLEADERARIDAALARLDEMGIDVDDIDAVGEGFDEAHRAWQQDQSRDSAQVVDTFAVAIGEHLARHSARDWAVVTDVFGTDLGLVAARAETVVVPHNLVGSRWMRGERGWIPGVVNHLVSMRPRRR
ncbi:uncharacterized protein DUF3806 [Terracoccus luteus]|uniref:Uncharacterized protein DUF3806 n=1 Tax=Terracoccus luteus TaxID=53356 RepID=A0A495XRR8_9MICO|nr:DUF3806 domain-containing protein [Terracoccus luteus]RKT77241.1 uncharacterized protein DUF3806 [Terracoccus luteus]